MDVLDNYEKTLQAGLMKVCKSAGMLGALAEVFPDAMYQRCTVHFYRNVLAKVPARRGRRVAAQLKAIRAQESLAAGLRKAEEVAHELEAPKLADAARVIRGGVAETLTYARFPMEHWRRIRANNGIGRLNREVKRRTNAVGSSPDGRSAMMLAAARRKHGLGTLHQVRPTHGVTRHLRKILDGTRSRAQGRGTSGTNLRPLFHTSSLVPVRPLFQSQSWDARRPPKQKRGPDLTVRPPPGHAMKRSRPRRACASS